MPDNSDEADLELELDKAALSEIRRQSRLIDQATSMQSSLRDWDRAFGVLLLCIVMIASVVGIAFAFAAGGEQVTVFGVQAQRATWLGWLAIVTLSITLIELILDPRGAARRREQAVRALAQLKVEYRLTVPTDEVRVEAARRTERYEAVTRTLPAIPEPLFNRLKAAHLRKIEVSKIISSNPGMSARQAKKVLKKRLG